MGIADLKAQLDYAKLKVEYFDKRLSEMSNAYDCEKREVWVSRMYKLEKEIEKSMNVLEE
jgi:hypothetical protein